MSTVWRKALFGAAMTAGIISAYPVFAIGPDKDGANVHRVHLHSGDRHGNGNLWIKDDDLELRARWEGDFEFNKAGDFVSYVDGRLEIERDLGEGLERVVYRGDGSNLEAIFTLNDKPISGNAESRINTLTSFFLLESGFDAEDRVEMLLSEGGPEAVFATVEKMQFGHGARKYLTALAQERQLSDASLDRYTSIVSNLSGDHAKYKSIAAIFDTQAALSPATADKLLKAAAAIEGDHELRKLIQAAAEGRTLSSSGADIAMGLMARISGDHDLRKSAQVLLANPSVNDTHASKVLSISAKKISGDHDLRKVVEAGAMRAVDSEAIAAASINVLDAISSDHDRRKAIEALARSLPASSAHWDTLIEATEAIGSDHDKRKALASLAGQMPRQTRLVEVYKNAAASISSDHDREKALQYIP